jgi:hypothetical protein
LLAPAAPHDEDADKKKGDKTVQSKKAGKTVQSQCVSP